MRGHYERGTRKTAKELVEEFGASLVGRFVRTEAIGDWPGGRARVTKIAPDAAAPEIVFEVSGAANIAVQEAVKRGRLSDEVIGVFAGEAVEIAT